ncbi:hypothetical protein VNI00_019064 [Paramarasmius palmivorus]|uniref:BZIP domain-containing protein n=1 Tax=Paramarasmius palmivorus TaxID=297713 RepID=A0AAW0AQC8_9AGAR
MPNLCRKPECKIANGGEAPPMRKHKCPYRKGRVASHTSPTSPASPVSPASPADFTGSRMPPFSPSPSPLYLTPLTQPSGTPQFNIPTPFMQLTSGSTPSDGYGLDIERIFNEWPLSVSTPYDDQPRPNEDPFQWNETVPEPNVMTGIFNTPDSLDFLTNLAPDTITQSSPVDMLDISELIKMTPVPPDESTPTSDQATSHTPIVADTDTDSNVPSKRAAPDANLPGSDAQKHFKSMTQEEDEGEDEGEDGPSDDGSDDEADSDYIEDHRKRTKLCSTKSKRVKRWATDLGKTCRPFVFLYISRPESILANSGRCTTYMSEPMRTVGGEAFRQELHSKVHAYARSVQLAQGSAFTMNCQVVHQRALEKQLAASEADNKKLREKLLTYQQQACSQGQGQGQ